jgi:hypothetical protein
VSWVEEARKEAQKREAFRSNVSSQERPCHTTGFSSVTEGAANQVDWRAVVVVDPLRETNPPPMWEKEILLGDGGWKTSLAKREC